jgi:predicted DNA-binding transcriptional regulator AlpA
MAHRLLFSVQQELRRSNMMRFLRLKQIIGTPKDRGRVPVSASTWWAGVRSGRFPQPIKLGPRTTVWRESDIEAMGARDTNKEEG